MYFRVNLKMKKPICCCFAWMKFIELNFTVAFLSIRKTWDDQFPGKVGGGMGDFKKWGILVMGGGSDFEMGRLITLYGLWSRI